MEERRRVYPPNRESREAARVACAVPVAIVSPAHWPEARVLDLSRTGIRLGVTVQDRQKGLEFGLERLAEMMRTQLAVNLIVELGPEARGNRIRRGLRVVRMGPFREEEGCLELGCELLPPLDEAEVEALGLALPLPGESADGALARRDLRGREPREPDAKRPPGLRGTVRQHDPALDWEEVTRVPRPGSGVRAAGRLAAALESRHHKAPALSGRPLEFSPDGGYLWVDVGDTNEFFPHDAPIADRVLAFARHWGQALELSIADGVDDVWSGPIRVVSVGILPEVPGRLILGFRHRRPLEPWARKALGVPSEMSVR